MALLQSYNFIYMTPESQKILAEGLGIFMALSGMGIMICLALYGDDLLNLFKKPKK